MLTGNKDVDLLIASKLNDSEIENLDKCVNLKDDRSFWKNRLKDKYNLPVECLVKSWKKLYLEHAKFVEFYHLTLSYNLLKDYYENDYSINYLMLMREKKSENFFPLFSSILKFLNSCSSDIPREFDIFLTDNSDYLFFVENMYENIYYRFTNNLRIGGKFWKLDFLNEYFSSIIYNNIILRRNLLPSTLKMESRGTLEITFHPLNLPV